VTRLRGNVDEPVRRYFSHAIDDGAPPATRFRFGMTGRIRVGRLWLPFTAEQELAADALNGRPGLAADCAKSPTGMPPGRR
jgi:hypothetical protein